MQASGVHARPACADCIWAQHAQQVSIMYNRLDLDRSSRDGPCLAITITTLCPVNCQGKLAHGHMPLVQVVKTAVRPVLWVTDTCNNSDR